MVDLAAGLFDTAEDAINLRKEMDMARQALENIAKFWEIKVSTINTVTNQTGGPIGWQPPAGTTTDPPPADTGGGGTGPCPTGYVRVNGKCLPAVSQFQHGADFIVPRGYPNDTFPMRVTSGEHVQVTPRGRGRGGNILVQQFFTIRGGGNPYFIAQEAANQAATILGDKMRG
jgi:hypothetical protein